MRLLPLTLCAAGMASAALGAPSDKQLEGHWPAVKIALMKNATKDQAAEESRLGFYSLDLKPHYRAELMYGVPVEGKWSLKGRTLELIPDVVHSNGPDGKVTVTLTPIYLKLDQDGKTLTRTFDGRIVVFGKRVG